MSKFLKVAFFLAFMIIGFAVTSNHSYAKSFHYSSYHTTRSNYTYVYHAPKVYKPVKITIPKFHTIRLTTPRIHTIHIKAYRTSNTFHISTPKAYVSKVYHAPAIHHIKSVKHVTIKHYASVNPIHIKHIAAHKHTTVKHSYVFHTVKHHSVKHTGIKHVSTHKNVVTGTHKAVKHHVIKHSTHKGTKHTVKRSKHRIVKHVSAHKHTTRKHTARHAHRSAHKHSVSHKSSLKHTHIRHIVKYHKKTRYAPPKARYYKFKHAKKIRYANYRNNTVWLL